MAQVLTADKQIQDDHRQARDAIFDLFKACQERDHRKARELADLIDQVAGPHWRWEEEALYPAVGKLSEDLQASLLKEHDEVIEAVQKIKDIVNQKHISPQDWEFIRDRAQVMLYHISACDGLIIMIEVLGEDDLVNIRQTIFIAQREQVRLLEWAKTLRQR